MDETILKAWAPVFSGHQEMYDAIVAMIKAYHEAEVEPKASESFVFKVQLALAKRIEALEKRLPELDEAKNSNRRCWKEYVEIGGKVQALEDDLEEHKLITFTKEPDKQPEPCCEYARLKGQYGGHMELCAFRSGEIIQICNKCLKKLTTYQED